MLLIVTERSDLTTDWMVLELTRRGAQFVRFNTEDYPSRVGLEWSLAGGSLEIAGRSVSLSDIDAIWYRRPVPPRVDQAPSAAHGEWASRESAAALLGLWRTLPALWVNHPDRNRLANSKPEQLLTARQLGFEVPLTIVTNRGEDLRQFLAQSSGPVVCKPIWSGRVPTANGEKIFFTSVVDQRAVATDRLGPEPYMFQEQVDKEYDIRVTVIGEDAFSVRIMSQDAFESRIDWRRGQPEQVRHEREALPDQIAGACVNLCRHYGLAFAAIDLAKRPDGGFTFFEINPNGQWAWVEQRTGLPLRSKLADLLLRVPGN